MHLLPEERPNPIRVLAVDDSVTIRETLGLLVGAQPDMEMVGTAANGQEAVRQAAELQADIVLMDIHMPDLDGIQATWLVSSRAPHGAVIMVTSEERIDFLQKAMSAGAQGYVLKPFGNGAQLFQTIREVHGRSSARRIQVVGGTPLDTSLRPQIGKRIVVVGPKGGVGTTTLAVSVALALSEHKQASNDRTVRSSNGCSSGGLPPFADQTMYPRRVPPRTRCASTIASGADTPRRSGVLDVAASRTVAPLTMMAVTGRPSPGDGRLASTSTRSPDWMSRNKSSDPVMGTPTATASPAIFDASELVPRAPGVSGGVGALTGWAGAGSARGTWSSVNTTPKVNTPALTITSAARKGRTNYPTP
jgi:CheY-like chemotaxis protein